MSKTPDEWDLTPNEWIDSYIEMADRMEPPWETVYMLGALMASAVGWGELRDAPPEWGWPAATKNFNGE